MDKNFYSRLKEILPADRIKEEEPMRLHTTFRVGGPARFFVMPKTAEELQGIIACCREAQVPYYIIGNGSNLLVSDQGYEGVVIQIFKEMNEIRIEGEEIVAQAGALLSTVAARAAEASLTGFEFAAGIPGTLGGACVMNAGAYGGEMKDVLTEVQALTREGEVLTIPKDELELGYRTSVIAKKGYIVLEAKLRLEKGEEADIRARLGAIRRGEAQEQPQPVQRPTPRRQRHYTVQGGRLPERRPQKLHGFRALYVSYLYLLGVRRPRGKRQYPFPIRAEVTKLHRYQRQMKLLQTYRIDTEQQLAMLESAFQAEIDALTEQRKELYQQKRAGEDVTSEIESINQELRRLRGQLKTCGQIAADIPRIRAQAETCHAQARREKEDREKNLAANRESRPDRHFGPVR